MITRILRAFAVAWSLGTAAMPAALSIGDAEAQAASYAAHAHVEVEGGAACPEGHDPHCAICSTLRTFRAVSPQHRPDPVASAAPMRVPPWCRSAGPATSHDPAVRPRAPPLVS